MSGEPQATNHKQRVVLARRLIVFETTMSLRIFGRSCGKNEQSIVVHVNVAARSIRINTPVGIKGSRINRIIASFDGNLEMNVFHRGLWVTKASLTAVVHLFNNK